MCVKTILCILLIYISYFNTTNFKNWICSEMRWQNSVLHFLRIFRNISTVRKLYCVTNLILFVTYNHAAAYIKRSHYQYLQTPSSIFSLPSVFIFYMEKMFAMSKTLSYHCFSETFKYTFASKISFNLY